MFGESSLAPRFILVKYMIKFYIEYFGIHCYMLVFVGIIAFFLIKSIIINIKRKEFDRVLMILFLGIIIIGGLVGIGLDFYNNNIRIP